jgi:hypothetical protein
MAHIGAAVWTEPKNKPEEQERLAIYCGGRGKIFGDTLNDVASMQQTFRRAGEHWRTRLNKSRQKVEKES